jgi:hypothetical protein
MTSQWTTLLPSGNKGSNSTLKDAALQEDTALAFKAFKANISPHPYYLPLIAATGVFLVEADHVTQLYLHNHSFASKSSIGVNLVAQ